MDWISVVISTGGLVGIVTAFLTYRTNRKERRIQWYDRAIREIERLENKLDDCEEKATEYRDRYYESKANNRKGDE